jgi:hypothetical protein
MAEPTLAKKDDAELVDMLHSENQAGLVLYATHGLLMSCSLWWLCALRMRVEVRY